jgi:aspartate kinase
MIVAKFGGSSLSDASRFNQVREIINSDSKRRYLVVSAPGKRSPSDIKITDLLLDCHRCVKAGRSFDDEFSMIAIRFQNIAEGLGLTGYLDEKLRKVKRTITQEASRDYIVSRGEYLCAILMAKWLDIPFIDAADVVLFNTDGKFDINGTLPILRDALLSHERAVIPGFYGADKEGIIHAFTRGGSDISGALAAAAVDADLYENWTDVTGFRSADPRIIPDASFISTLTYRELRELSYMGANVMHEEAVFPVRNAGIPTSIRNTGNPQHPGTLIVHSPRQIGRIPAVTGIAGKRGFSTIIIEKNQMNDEIGFGRKVLEVLEKHRINFEHLPTGIDTMCVMVNTAALSRAKKAVLDGIEAAVQPDTLSVQEGIALVTCVGNGLFKKHGTIARLFTAVSEQGIQIRTVFQAPSELSIIIGISEDSLERAITAIYDAFIRE